MIFGVALAQIANSLGLAHLTPLGQRIIAASDLFLKLTRPLARRLDAPLVAPVRPYGEALQGTVAIAVIQDEALGPGFCYANAETLDAIMGHDRRYAIDFSRAEAELGWAPEFEFPDGLERTVAWYRENGGWVAAVTDG